MDNRLTIIWIFGIGCMAAVVLYMTFASMQNTKARTDASVAKSQEHTKRADGRHELFEFFWKNHNK